MDILHRSYTRPHRHATFPTLSSSFPTQMMGKRVNRALSAHAKPSFSSSWDYNRPKSSGSLDTILTCSSSSASISEQYEPYGGSVGSTHLHTCSRGRSRFSKHKAAHFLSRHSSGSPASPSKRLRHSKNEAPTSVPMEDETDDGFFFWRERRFLTNTSKRYYLPSDLREFQRQDLLVLLLSEVFGGPTCIPIDYANPPQSILDIGSGDGFWATLTHDHFVNLGITPPRFTGIDVMDMSGELRLQGIDWTFQQHDTLKLPLPFADESFDLVHFGSMSMVFEFDWNLWLSFMEECFRILKPGGYLETRDIDQFIRRVTPRDCIEPLGECEQHKDCLARKFGCYPIDEDVQFTPCENRFIKDRNAWLSSFFDNNQICGHFMQTLSQTKFLSDSNLAQMKRIAIPLSNNPTTEEMCKILTPEQDIVRQTALELLIQETESLESVFREISGKSDEDWAEWWDEMMQDLVHNNGCADGECLEAGDWWVKKPERNSRFQDMGPL